MEPEGLEFIALIDASGWKDAEVARQLGVSRSAISQIHAGRSKPSGTLLSLFKMVLMREKPHVLTGKPEGALAEERQESETELWKRRCLAAEKRIEHTNRVLRQLLSQGTTPMPEEKVNPVGETKLLAAVEEVADLMLKDTPQTYGAHQRRPRKARP